MIQLDYREAKSLSAVFYEPDLRIMALLLTFQDALTKYEAWTKTKTLPEGYRFSQKHLYRKVDQLEKLHFLQIVNKKRFPKRTRFPTMNYYQLSFKGILASFIYAYVLHFDKKTPRILKDKIQLLGLPAMAKDHPAWWHQFVSFLRWHRGHDLHSSELSLSYFSNLNFAIQLAELESLGEKDSDTFEREMRERGWDGTDEELKRGIEAVQGLKRRSKDHENSLLAKVRKSIQERPREDEI